MEIFATIIIGSLFYLCAYFIISSINKAFSKKKEEDIENK